MKYFLPLVWFTYVLAKRWLVRRRRPALAVSQIQDRLRNSQRVICGCFVGDLCQQDVDCLLHFNSFRLNVDVVLPSVNYDDSSWSHFDRKRVIQDGPYLLGGFVHVCL